MAYFGNEPAKVATKVGVGVITATELADDSITTADIVADAITPTELSESATGYQVGSIGVGTAVTGTHKLVVGGTASFTGAITGDLTGDVTGQAGTVATIAGLAPNTATTQATQGAITSLGTLISLTGGTGDLVWDTTTLVVDSSANKVGIGTASPSNILNITHAGETGLFIHRSGASGGDHNLMMNTDDVVNNTNKILFNVGNFPNGGVGESGNTTYAGIEAKLTQVNTQKGQLRFYVNTGDTHTTALTLNDTGNAKFNGEVYVGGATGLGTAKLQVVGTQTTDLGDPQSVIYGGIVSGAYSTLGFGHIEALYPESPIEIGSKCVNTGAGGYSDFFIATRSGTSGAPTTRLTIGSDGNATFAGYINVKFDNQGSRLGGHNGGLEVRSTKASDMGIYGSNSSGDFRFQIYGDGTNYGFLGTNWGDWDLRKVPTGKLYLNNNDTYYLQPDSTTHLNTLTTNGNATFGGNIILDDGDSNNSNNLTFENTGYTNYEMDCTSGGFRLFRTGQAVAFDADADHNISGQKLSVVNANGVWGNSGAWNTQYDFGSEPSGSMYRYNVDLQGLDGYTCTGTIMKTRAGHYRLHKETLGSTNVQFSGSNFQANQNSGAGQTGSAGQVIIRRILSAKA